MPKKLQIPSQMPEIQPETLSQIHPARLWIPCHSPCTMFFADIDNLAHRRGKGIHNPRNDLRHRLYDLHDGWWQVLDQRHK